MIVGLLVVCTVFGPIASSTPPLTSPLLSPPPCSHLLPPLISSLLLLHPPSSHIPLPCSYIPLPLTSPCLTTLHFNPPLTFPLLTPLLNPYLTFPILSQHLTSPPLDPPSPPVRSPNIHTHLSSIAFTPFPTSPVSFRFYTFFH
ncbi:hypothetical protein Pmani_022006 [Petrolisthes manimaculis]|uniref:Uncharacterized protein n=1 Tax=Petrolisthes manimaculis TaxID=1843537 RepID=A0AAE1PCW7_9EUCA|nr:hypothetical protein Pmani_022006 [Petrolisthes manimaculis]